MRGDNKTRKGRRKQRRQRGQWSAKRSEESPERPERKTGDPATHYRTDPLRGDKIAHAVAKHLRQGMTPRKTAKMFGLTVDRVLEIREALNR